MSLLLSLVAMFLALAVVFMAATLALLLEVIF